MLVALGRLLLIAVTLDSDDYYYYYLKKKLTFRDQCVLYIIVAFVIVLFMQ